MDAPLSAVRDAPLERSPVHTALTCSVSPSSDGTYECPCGYHPRRTVYPNLDAFKSHLRHLIDVCKDEHKELPVILTGQLVQTSTLSLYSLVINTRFQLLICIPCYAVVLPKNITQHMRKSHSVTLGTPDARLVQSICDEFSVAAAYPSNPTEPTETIDSLRVVEGYQCTACNLAYALPSSFKTHFRTAHREQRFPQDIPSVALQHFTENGPGSTYFVVIPPSSDWEPVTDTDAILTAAARTLSVTYEDEAVRDVRNVSPWLRVTQWHELLMNHTVSDLVKLAERPSRSEYPSLHDVVEDLVDKAAACIDRTTTLVLQILNSPRGPNDISNKPFKMHNDCTTLTNYTRVVTSLVAMLLRKSLVTLPQEVQLELERFKTSLARGTNEEAVEHLQALLLSIWQRPWPVTEEQRVSDPTILFLALSSLTPSGRFQEPKNVTHTISSFEYLMRLIFLKSIHSYPSIDEGVRSLQPWFIEKKESTFNSLRTLQHFASSIAYQTMGLPRIWWTDRTTHLSMLYQGYPVELRHVVEMLQDLEEKIKDTWESDILCSLPLSIQYSFLYDDLSNKEPGYSFTNDPKNTAFSDQQILLRGILTNPALRSRFIASESGGTVHWNTNELRMWLADYARLSLLTLVRSNLTGGSPGRITELTATQLVNLATYATRNLVMFNKHLAILCTYLKTSALTGYDRLIPHSLDSFLSDILIQDLAIARPFARFAARVCHSNRPDIIRRFDTHLFVNHTTLFNTEDVTRMLTTVGLSHFEFPLTVNSWRHISTAYRRLHCSRFQHLLDEGNNDSIDAAQSGHSKRTENRLYGLSHDTLSGAGEDVLPLFLDASTDWQMVCSVVPGGTGLPYQKARMSLFESLVKKGTIDPPQTEAGVTVQDMFKALERTIIERLEKLERLVVPKVQLPYSLPSPREKSLEIASSTKSQSGSQAVSSIGNLSDEDMESEALSALRRALGKPNASWANQEQKSAVLTMLEHKRDAIIVMATGSGKSMIPIIPSLVENNRITVLLLPFRSLVADFTSKLTRMSVPFEVYSPTKRLTAQSNLVVVSADHATTDEWRESIVLANMARPVARYVLDEAHIPPTTSDYREALRYMSDIRCPFPVQLALMTGTAHDRLVDVLRTQFCIGPDSLQIRMPTNRRELRYEWTTPDPTSVVQTVHALILSHVKYPEDRGLIFVPFLSSGRELAEELQLPFYHGKLDESESSRLYDQWRNGKHPTMIATSAFGTGNDYPHVRLIIHAGTPFEMMTFIQEVSRGGRDGKPAACVLLQSESSRPLPTNLNVITDLSGKIAMHEALHKHTGRCIRFILTSYIDGRGVYCSTLPGNQPCSRCICMMNARRPRSPSFEESTQQAKRLRQERRVEENSYVSAFKALLSHFENSCAFCLVFEVKSSPHDMKQCPTLTRELGAGGARRFFDWKRGIRYSEYHSGICYHCHIPQGPNDTLHPTFQRTKGSCQYPDIVAPAVFAILLKNGSAASKQFKFDICQPIDALQFINGPPLPSQSSNITAIFLWYGAAIRKKDI